MIILNTLLPHLICILLLLKMLFSFMGTAKNSPIMIK
jgi:hypothetical protein